MTAVDYEDDLLSQVVAECMVRADAGETVLAAEYRDRYPQLADDLDEYFATVDVVERLAGPRADTQPGAVLETMDMPISGMSPAIASPENVLCDTHSIAAGDSVPKTAGEEDLLPKRLGRYRILSRLGHGGMGEVYLAHDEQVDRNIALKIPKTAGPEEREILKRFQLEASTAGKLRHPHICPVYDYGEIEGRPFLAMAYIEGHTLSDVLENNGPLPQLDTEKLISKLALALQAAHESGVIHRDLKPSNIMIGEDGEPVIMDFGLARRLTTDNEEIRLTQTGTLVGTPAYMSPEQVSGENNSLTPATDTYCLGVILYELLTGRLPFEGGITSVLAQIQRDAPVPPSKLCPGIDTRLEALCLRMLAKEIQERPASMQAVAEELDSITSIPLESLPDTILNFVPSIRQIREDRKYHIPVWLLFGGLVSVLAAGIVIVIVIRGNNNSAITRGEKAEIGKQNVTLPPTKTKWDGTVKSWQLIPVIPQGLYSAVAWHPTAPLIAFGTMHGGIRICDADTLQVKHLLDGHTSSVGPLRWSPNGEWLASGSGDGTVRLWKRDGAGGRVFAKHMSGISALDWSPDSTRIASVGSAADGKERVTIWDISNGKIHHKFQAAATYVSSISWHPTRNELLIGGGDRQLRIFSLDGRQRRDLGPNLPNIKAAFSPRGGKVAVGMNDHFGQDPVTRIWTPTEAEGPTLKGHTQPLSSLRWSRAGDRLATASGDKTVMVWNSDYRLVSELKGHTHHVMDIAFSPDGRRIATASDAVRLFSIDGTPGLLVKAPQLQIIPFAVRPDGLMATAGYEGAIRLWEPGGKTKTVLIGHQASVSSLAFSPDGKRLASSSQDHTVRVWRTDGENVAPLVLSEHTDVVDNVRWSPNGQWLVSSSQDGTIRFWSPDGTPGPILAKHHKSGGALRFRPGTQMLSWKDYVPRPGEPDKANAIVRTWDANTKTEGPIFDQPIEFYDYAWSPDGNDLLIAGNYGRMNLWNVAAKSSKSLSERGVGPHTSHIKLVAFRHDGEVFASSSSDDTVRLWNRDGTPRAVLNGARLIAFSPNSRQLATTTPGSERVLIWDDNGKATAKFHALPNLGGTIQSLHWMPDGRTLLAHGDVLQQWDLRTGRLVWLAAHCSEGRSATFSTDGALLFGNEAVVAGDYAVRVTTKAGKTVVVPYASFLARHKDTGD